MLIERRAEGFDHWNAEKKADAKSLPTLRAKIACQQMNPLLEFKYSRIDCAQTNRPEVAKEMGIAMLKPSYGLLFFSFLDLRIGRVSVSVVAGRRVTFSFGVNCPVLESR